MEAEEIVAGIDLGATDTKFGLVNREGELLAFNTIPTNAGLDYDLFFDLLADKIDELMHSLGNAYQLAGVSVGAPTGSQSNGTIDNASNLNWPEKLPVAKILESIFGLPVIVSNDANAAALGEMLFGVASERVNFIVVTLGTGLGCGIIVDGKLVLGSRGHAGELGHVRAVDNGRDCGCGRKGCLETYVSATGVVRTVLEASADELEKSSLRSFNKNTLTAKKITKAALEGDPLACKVFEKTGEIFGKSLADTVALLNPELIVLTGGLSKAGDLILKPTEKYLNKHLLSIYKDTVELKLSEISTKKTAILGLAATMWLKLDPIRKISV